MMETAGDVVTTLRTPAGLRKRMYESCDPSNSDSNDSLRSEKEMLKQAVYEMRDFLKQLVVPQQDQSPTSDSSMPVTPNLWRIMILLLDGICLWGTMT